MRIHRQYTIYQKPEQESIQKAIDELMDIFDTEKLLITKPTANSKAKAQSRSPNSRRIFLSGWNTILFVFVIR